MELKTLFTRTRVPGSKLVRTHCIVCGLLVGCSAEAEVLRLVEAVHSEHRHRSDQTSPADHCSDKQPYRAGLLCS